MGVLGHGGALFQVSVDDFKKMSGGLRVEGAGMSIFIHQVMTDMVLHNFSGQARQSASGSGQKMQYLVAVGIGLKGPFDCLNLTADTTDTSEEFLLFSGGMDHNQIMAYPPSLYNSQTLQGLEHPQCIDVVVRGVSEGTGQADKTVKPQFLPKVDCRLIEADH